MSTPSRTPFGALLNRYRLTAGLTQEGLAERAGLSTRGIQDLERGARTAPRAETVRLLADALKLDHAARAGLVAAAHPELVAPAPPRLDSWRPPAVPIPPTSLVGREREVAVACALLRRPGGNEGSRLLTLTGPGGVGKTRLALAIAAEVAADFADGVAWVDLAPVRDSALVATAVGHALGIHETGDRPVADLLPAYVAERGLLLVLDNCEHLLPAAPLVGDLLAAGPRLTVLATSRARLRLRGERELPISPLAVLDVAEDAQSPLAGMAGVAAVRLFVERAAEVRAGFVLSDENTPAVAAICRRLDGLPLAIELAAARAKILPPAALLARLEQRLPLLTTGARDLPLRQQTMHDAIAWSYELLGESEQALFRRLAVFSGGCTLAAAEAIAGAGSGVPRAAVLDLIASLGDQSLLRIVDGPAGEPRISQFETIREFGLQRLGERAEEDAVRDAHAAYFLALAETAEVGLKGAEQVAWLDRLQAEHDNLRAALRWLPQRGAVQEALRLAGALWFFRWVRGYYAESRAQFEALLALPGATKRTPARAKALNGLGVVALSQGDTELAVAVHEEALAISREIGDELGTAFSLNCLATALFTSGDFDRGEKLAAESLELGQRLGDRWGAQIALGLLAFAALSQGNQQRAEHLLTECIAAGRGLGVRWGTALDLANLGWLVLERGDNQRASELSAEALVMMEELGDMRDPPYSLVGLGLAVQRQGDLTRAAAYYEEALAIARKTGEQRSIARTLFRLADVARQHGDHGKALELARRALVIYQAIGDPRFLAVSIEAVAVLAAEMGDLEQAVRLLGAASDQFERAGKPVLQVDRFDHAEVAARSRETMGAAAYGTALAAGRRLTLAEAAAEALAWSIAPA